MKTALCYFLIIVYLSWLADKIASSLPLERLSFERETSTFRMLSFQQMSGTCVYFVVATALQTIQLPAQLFWLAITQFFGVDWNKNTRLCLRKRNLLTSNIRSHTKCSRDLMRTKSICCKIVNWTMFTYSFKHCHVPLLAGL